MFSPYPQAYLRLKFRCNWKIPAYGGPTAMASSGYTNWTCEFSSIPVAKSPIANA